MPCTEVTWIRHTGRSLFSYLVHEEKESPAAGESGHGWAEPGSRDSSSFPSAERQPSAAGTNVQTLFSLIHLYSNKDVHVVADNKPH